MRTSEFDYHLPPDLIATRPSARREAGRLLVLDRSTGARHHTCFRAIGRYLCRGDLLVLNDTRVRPARLCGRWADTGGRVELLLVREVERGRWECLLQPLKKAAVGRSICDPEGNWPACRVARVGAGRAWVDFGGEVEVSDLIARWGRMPLPPYILRERRRRGEEEPADSHDRIWYQTAFAREEGAIAAPTAGLHFSRRLLGSLADLGIDSAFLTLHVGPATFLPVLTEEVGEHRLDSEAYDLPEETVRRVLEARERGNRVVAVGTTVVRALEGAANRGGELKPGRGETSLFIRPPFIFRLTDALVTNFHLPCSTLLMLVSAFAGRERILQVYEEVVERGYGFYSYGDGMLIL